LNIGLFEKPPSTAKALQAVWKHIAIGKQRLLPFGRKSLRENDMGDTPRDEVIASWYEAAVKPECLLGQCVSDALSIGLAVVDVEGRLQFANEAAMRCLRRARGIQVRNGRVAMTETSAHTRLCGLLAAVSQGGFCWRHPMTAIAS